MISQQSTILAADTATPIHSIAICRGGLKIYEASLSTSPRRRPALLRAVDQSLEICKLSLKDIDALAIGRGPGAFTSLRVSMAVFKTLAFTHQIPLYSTSSLDGIALAVPAMAPLIAPVIDARRGEIYVRLYSLEKGGYVPVTEDALIRPVDLGDWLKRAKSETKGLEIGEEVSLIGHGAIRKALEGVDHTRVVDLAVSPSASAIAASVLAQFEGRAPAIALRQLEPKYLRTENFATPKPFFEKS